jgi:hypothetical protein
LATDSQIILSQHLLPLESFLKTSSLKKTKLTVNEIEELRRIVIEIIKLLVSKDITLEEMKAIIYFLQNNNKSRQLCDVLNLILWLLQNGTKGALDAINDLGGMSFVFY